MNASVVVILVVAAVVGDAVGTFMDSAIVFGAVVICNILVIDVVDLGACCICSCY